MHLWLVIAVSLTVGTCVPCVRAIIRGSASRESPADGVEFQTDELIGAPKLWSNGNQWARSSQNWRITLLVQEGRAILSKSGFLVGYQWYNDMYGENNKPNKIKFQIYRRLSNGSSLDIHPDIPSSQEGNFMLLHQTEVIKCVAGFNVYYLPDPYAIDTRADGDSEIFVAFMVPPITNDGMTPLLHDYCSGGKQVELSAWRTSDSMQVGQQLEFILDEYYADCISYSVQAIFMPTNGASNDSTHEVCNVCIAELDTRDCAIELPQNYPRDTNMCWLVRGSRDYNGLKIIRDQFHMDDCSQSVAVAFPWLFDIETVPRVDLNYYDAEDIRIMSCNNQDEFKNMESDKSYAYVHFFTGNDGISDTKLKFVVQEKALGSVWLTILLVVVLPIVSILLLVVCITFCCCKGWCCTCCCCKKRKISQRNAPAVNDENESLKRGAEAVHNPVATVQPVYPPIGQQQPAPSYYPQQPALPGAQPYHYQQPVHQSYYQPPPPTTGEQPGDSNQMYPQPGPYPAYGAAPPEYSSVVPLEEKQKI